MIGKLLISWLAHRAYKSISAWLLASLTATGTAATIDPDLLQLIPEHYRGPFMLVIGALIAASRLRQEYRIVQLKKEH